MIERMSVSEFRGDLIRDGRGILCHQVNFFGVMGGGIARSIKDKLLSDREYRHYQSDCERLGAALLGKVLYLPALDGRTVANMYCQRANVVDNSLTDYKAMRECLEEVRTVALGGKLPVSIPGHLGCGIAGGDWNTVWKIILDVFADSPVRASIIYWEQERRG